MMSGERFPEVWSEDCELAVGQCGTSRLATILDAKSALGLKI